VAKNVATYAFSFALFLASAGASIALGGAPPPWALAGALALHAGAGPWFLGAGNVVSIVNPRPAPHTVQRGGNLSPVSAFAGMAIFSSVGLLFSLPVLLAIRLDQPWILPGGWAALGAAGFAAYRASLPRMARLLQARREPLLEAVCGDDA
jgi:ABC-2 type transport system permease protein